MEQNEETQKLFRAVKFGKSKEVKQLLENDASLLNSVDSKANTLLHMAAKNGHKNIVKELLRRAIDTEAANEDGKVAWELALQYNFKPLAMYIREKMQLPPLDGEGGTEDGEAMTSSRPQDGLDVLSELTGDDVGRAEGVGSPQAMPTLQPSAVQAASPGPVDVQSHGPATASPGSDRRALEERAALEAVVKTLWGRFGVLAGGSRAVKNNARLEEELRALKVRFGGGEVGDVESVLSERDDLVKRAAEHEREAEKQKQRIERLEEDVGYTREARERAEEERNEAVQRARAERQSKDEAEREARRAREEAEDGRAELERARSEVRAAQQQVQGLKGGLKTTLKEMHVPGLTPAELQVLFEKHDRDRSGEISPEELRGLVRELGEVFDSRVQDAREEARAATARADTAEQDRKRHVDRAREELAEQTKQVKQLREELAAADEARRTALAEAQRRADAARQEMQKRLDKAAKEHEMVLKKMVEEHNAETTRAEEQAKKEAAEAKKAHAKEAKELQKRATDAEKDVEIERAQRKMAEARQHEAQAALEEARAALHRAALLEAASQSQTCLRKLFALRGRLRETSAAFRDARRAAAEHADGVRGGFREIREALAGYVTFILPLAHERPENVRTERLSPAQLGQALRHMMGKYRGAAERCRALNAEMQGLKGAMRVYCRVRPLRDAEAADGASIHLRGLGELSVLAKAGGTREYRFDTAYGPRASQEEVFADARPLLQTAVDGYNVSVFAYGPTGAGKTYTMTGNRASRRHRGLVYRMLEDVFATQKERATLADMEVRLSMFEIYNEAVRDLLAPGAHERAGWEDGAAREGASLKVSTDKRGNVHVEGLTEHRVDGLQRGLALVEYGQEVRATGATNLNEHSSRSHLLIRLGVRTVDRRTGARAVGKMYLIDLAGSENVQQSGAAGKQLKEAIGINKSLAALHDVMLALSSKDAHVPYRNSLLTRVLADSLGGTATCLMYVMVSPAMRERAITQAALKFAGRCKSIELAPAQKATDASAELEADKAREEAAALRAQLEAALGKGKEEEGRVELSKEIILEADRFEAKLREMFGFAAPERRRRPPPPGRKERGGGDRARKKVEALYLDEASQVLVRRRAASDELLRCISRGVEALSDAVRQADERMARAEASAAELRSRLDAANARATAARIDRRSAERASFDSPAFPGALTRRPGAWFDAEEPLEVFEEFPAPRRARAPPADARAEWDARTRAPAEEPEGRASSVPQAKGRTRERLPYIGGGLG